MPEVHYQGKRPFLLIEGGPLYRIQRRVGLVRAQSPLIVRRAVFSIFITWVPLLVLSAISGFAVRNVELPFLKDIAAAARFLIAIPLLLIAEVITGPHLAQGAGHLVDASLILEKDYKEYDAAVESGLRLRDSTTAEIILVILALATTLNAFRHNALHISTWFRLWLPSGGHITTAGWWYVLFSLPLFNFLAFRWLWRMFLWYRFLYQINSLDLQLFPTHPDQAGGLGFLAESQQFFAVVFFGYSCAISGIVANEILYDTLKLDSFFAPLAIFLTLAVLISLAPLAMFSGRLLKLRRAGIFRYGAFATTYTGDFQRKWIDPQVADPESDAQVHGKPTVEETEPLLGTGDIQSLADLGNSYSFITKMNIVPFDPKAVLRIIIVCVIPMLPLLLTVMPLGELLKIALKMLA